MFSLEFVHWHLLVIPDDDVPGVRFLCQRRAVNLGQRGAAGEDMRNQERGVVQGPHLGAALDLQSFLAEQGRSLSPDGLIHPLRRAFHHRTRGDPPQFFSRYTFGSEGDVPLCKAPLR